MIFIAVKYLSEWVKYLKQRIFLITIGTSHGITCCKKLSRKLLCQLFIQIQLIWDLSVFALNNTTIGLFCSVLTSCFKSIAITAISNEYKKYCLTKNYNTWSNHSLEIYYKQIFVHYSLSPLCWSSLTKNYNTWSNHSLEIYHQQIFVHYNLSPLCWRDRQSLFADIKPSFGSYKQIALYGCVLISCQAQSGSAKTKTGMKSGLVKTQMRIKRIGVRVTKPIWYVH